MAAHREDDLTLSRSDLAEDPFEQFDAWWEYAAEKVPMPEAICLATVDEQGMPDARMVLLRGHGPDGFRFYTNYGSNKAAQLDGQGVAALCLYWKELDRQVRVRGKVKRATAEESDAYYFSRPPLHRLGAWASPQSQPIESRDELEKSLSEVEKRFADDEDVPRPENWGGYVLEPEAIEFWQGRIGRLHDRFTYTPDGSGGWTIQRLGP